MFEWMLVYLMAITPSGKEVTSFDDSVKIAEYYSYAYANTDSSKYSYMNPPFKDSRARGWMVLSFENLEALSFVLRNELFFSPKVIHFDNEAKIFTRYNVQQIIQFDSTKTYLSPTGKYEVRLIPYYDGWDSIITYVQPYSFVYLNDSLENPWISSGWTSTSSYNDTVRFISSPSSIKSTIGSWGAVGFHSGNWGAERILNVADYDTFGVSVFTEKNVKMNVTFTGIDSRWKKSFSLVSGWNNIVIEMNSVLVKTIKDVWIQKESSGQSTIYFDNIFFRKK